MSYLWLPRAGNNAHFESPPTCWDAQRLRFVSPRSFFPFVRFHSIRIQLTDSRDLFGSRILKSNKPKTVVFGHYYPYSWRQYQSSGVCGPRHPWLSEKEYRETFDALLAGEPESVLVMGDNPRLNFQPWRIKGEPCSHHKTSSANSTCLNTILTPPPDFDFPPIPNRGHY